MSAWTQGRLNPGLLCLKEIKTAPGRIGVHTVPMHIHFFELHYAHLPDSEDAVKVFGTVGIKAGIATVGEIRTACEGHPKDASIYPKPDGSGFRISDLHGKGSAP